MKKWTTLLLVTILLLSFSIPVFAIEAENPNHPTESKYMRLNDKISTRIYKRIWDKEIAEENRALLDNLKAERKAILTQLHERKASNLPFDESEKTQLLDFRQQLSIIHEELKATKGSIRSYIEENHDELKNLDQTVWEEFRKFTLDIQNMRNQNLKEIQHIHLEIKEIIQ
ncbi:MAG: hypothetical protein JXQ26_05855 [Tissierellales bacterium]|nr:hypothetical protein [Tissierellales bacterium]MBN2827491.1 hypothetical protein [Tissierellales bacterium]